MKTSVEFTEMEIRIILTNYVADRFEINSEDISIVLPNIVTHTPIEVQMRKDLIKKVEEFTNKLQKISAIKEFRLVTGAGLKVSKDFVENPKMWEAFILTGCYT